MDAVRSAMDKAAQFEKIKADRDQHYNEWLRCNQEGAIKERVRGRSCDSAEFLAA